jgi:hypothetical protein
MQANDNAAFLFVGNVTRSTNSTIPTLPNGAIGIFDEYGTAVIADMTDTAAHMATKLQVVQHKADGGLLFSPLFSMGDVLSKDYTAAAAVTEQVSYLGATSATAVTGIGTITTGNAYIFDIELLNGLNNAYTNPYIKTASYAASSADTEATVIKGLAISAMKNLYYGMPVPVVKVERVSNGTLQQITNNMAVVKDSQTITFTSNTYYGGSTALVAGDVLNLAGVSYIVTAVASLVVTIDIPYQGASGTLTAGATYNRIDPTTITHWGLKFTGLSLSSSFNKITSKYEVVRFAIKPKTGNDQIINPITGDPYDWALGFDSGIVEYAATKAKDGTGTYMQVAAEEVFLTAQNKEPFLRAFPPTNYTTEAVSTYTYDMTDLRIKKQLHNSFGTNSESYITITIACYASLTTNDNDILKTVFGSLT